ncbi:hypothetical protein [uncultured Kordia sp.]|uniref:hypothetical protein n=1 Tax=uncultured Kordia sp. TaxID=507699 RepID=UPI002631BFE7|nr:hypothetical protein [uncultured Kordia sp.]
MNLKIAYNKNKPLINSTLLAICYFLFCWSTDFGDATKRLFMFLMLFLPGLTFPLTTCYFKRKHDITPDLLKLVHLVLSVGIYFGSVWLFSGEGRIPYITLLAGFSGAFLFLFITRILLKKLIKWTHIIVASILSGLVFMPYEYIENNGFLLGLAVSLWTLINGVILNQEYRKTNTTVSTI